MKISMQWLGEWIDSPWPPREVGSRLTMSGFELEAVEEMDGDTTLELNVTPNRGDAMSVLGMAREVAALSGNMLRGPKIEPVPARCDALRKVSLDAPGACPRYAGRIIRNVNNRAVTPAWLQRRLQLCGIRSISPLVDVTNYVLLELGQPMHAYDLGKIDGEIRVRLAQQAESLTLLDERRIQVQDDVLLISDDSGGIGLAGIMGGGGTAVSETTREVFLEAAFFAPQAVLGRARRFALVTDAAQRFERGVDPQHQVRAIERATALILEIAGGEAGPTQLIESREHVPQRPKVPLRRSQLQRLLGAQIDPARVAATLTALGLQVSLSPEGWVAQAPSHRFDITIEADLIEEVARIVGFEAIAEVDAKVPRRVRAMPGELPAERSVLDTLVARGYHEAITLAFVDAKLQRRLFADAHAATLSNPIASDLAVMRVSLWPGLLRAALDNLARQHPRVRLFEHGVRFSAAAETDTLAGIACGAKLPEQWGLGKELRAPVDFYDVRADVESLLAACGAGASAFSFEPLSLPCLHPGRAAQIRRAGEPVGRLGELHPALVAELGFTYPPVLFEVDYQAALKVVRPAYREFSRYPLVRRDIALVVDESVSFSALRERVLLVAPAFLKACNPFDLYRGPGVETGRKSVALGLIFQDISRTLQDDEIAGAVTAILAELRASLNAKIRE